MLTAWMVYLIGVAVGMAAMYGIILPKKSGTLMIDKTNPENPTNLYLKLEEDIKALEKRKKVIFKIKIIR